MKNLIVGAVVVLAVLFVVLFAQPARAYEEPYHEAVVVVEHVTPQTYVKRYAQKYNVDGTLMKEVIECESKFKSIQSRIPKKGGPNGREDSWGVAQIHLPSHPTVTKAQALDPEFAIEWMAKQWSVGKQRQWTCYRDIVANN